MKSLRVLAVEPYYGGSHRAFLDAVTAHSRHHWTIVDAPAKQWKWRMRVSPLSLAHSAMEAVEDQRFPNVIFCSDMLDVPAWLGMIQRLDQRRNPWFELPVVTYFHENQWTYPKAPQSRVDHHYGYTNLLAAIASTACVFNSKFHRDSFLSASEDFVRRMPDSKSVHDFAALLGKSIVIPPGFDPPPFVVKDRTAEKQIRIGWVSRWEHDKRPEHFCELLTRIDHAGIGFRLVLLGPRVGESNELKTIRDRFGPQIIVDEYARTRAEYWNHLQDVDIVVSTADHEFFGIAICEAIWAGAAPVLPNRLSYPELVGSNHLYNSMDDAVAMIGSLVDASARIEQARKAKESIQRFQAKQTVPELDEFLEGEESLSGRPRPTVPHTGQ